MSTEKLNSFASALSFAFGAISLVTRSAREKMRYVRIVNLSRTRGQNAMHVELRGRYVLCFIPLSGYDRFCDLNQALRATSRRSALPGVFALLQKSIAKKVSNGEKVLLCRSSYASKCFVACFA